MKVSFAPCCLLLCSHLTLAASGRAEPVSDHPASSSQPSPKIYGVTVDSVDNLRGIVSALGKLAKRPTARIVFDEFVPATTYTEAITAIRPVANIMGELLDSSAVKQYSVEAYAKRAAEYVNAFPKSVDIWEVGNEINGEWLGDKADVTAKMLKAYDIVKAKGRPAALTLYYNQDCWEKPEHEMFRWAEANIPERMRKGLDYVLLSYYEDDCNNLQPAWPEVFSRLESLFPQAKLGFGEIGTKHASRKVDFINRYYGMTIPSTRFIGGYFWWYFVQDMIPPSTKYWQALNQAISRH